MRTCYVDGAEITCGDDRGDLSDARGIYCCKVCDRCEGAKRARYRPEVLDDPGYEASEPIEPED